MSKKPEALRLADELDKVPDVGADPDLVQESATELRRLHFINAELLESLKDCVDDSQEAVDEYIRVYGESFRPVCLAEMRGIVSKARADIAKAEGAAP